MLKPIFISGPKSLDTIDPTNPLYQEYDGIVGFSDTIDSPLLLAAYRKGIFPWSPRAPYYWFFTSPRLILNPSRFAVSHSLKKRIRHAREGLYREGSRRFDLDIRLDVGMNEVIEGCAAEREGQNGTWISRPLKRSYLDSVRDNFFHTVACYVDGRLCAGLMFDSIGRMFYGESMFTRKSDVSKIALAALVNIALRESVPMIDCQEASEHLTSLGGEPLEGKDFYDKLQTAVNLEPIEWNRYRGKPLNDLL